MALHDISVAIRNRMPVYPGDPAVDVDTPVSVANGASANVSRLRMGAHTGTHVDAPAHFLAGGSGVADLPLDALIGEVYVLEIPHTIRAITPEHVTSAIDAQCERVLFKTRGSSFWREERFRDDFSFLTADAARALVAAGVRLVGIDYLSIETFKSPTHETHRVLLEANIVILEGLDLTGIDPGVYELLCLPLKVADGAGDGAPARAVLRDLSPAEWTLRS